MTVSEEKELSRTILIGSDEIEVPIATYVTPYHGMCVSCASIQYTVWVESEPVCSIIDEYQVTARIAHENIHVTIAIVVSEDHHISRGYIMCS